MTENEIARVVVDACFRIHSTLGPGLLESVYEKILSYELADIGLYVEQQVSLPVVWKGITVAPAFRADLVVERKVLLELKSVDAIAPVHYKQLLTYLKVADKRLGLLINFGELLIKNGIKRIVNNL
ncbi:MAG: GxxExxY protein [Chlorobi bacterium]|nr:GxxExxY protein [Chlorobiota bacterium]